MRSSTTLPRHNLPYDCSSVMHYARNQMSRNGEDTITPLSSSCHLLPFSGWNHHTPRLSDLDVEMIQQQYGEYC